MIRNATMATAAFVVGLSGFVGAVQAQRTVPEAPYSVPLLDARGAALGTTRYGSAALPSEDDPARARLIEAAAAGLRGYTVYLDWPALEPSPGVYSFDAVRSELDALQALGIQSFVNITVGDIGEYVVPAPYADGEGGLAPGVRLDDPALLERFGALLDALVPELVDRGAFVLAVGNEIDDRLDDDAEERAAYRVFAEAARERVRALEPDLLVGITLTSNAHRGDTATRAALIDVTDFLAINYAPIAPDFFVRPEAEIAADFTEAMDAMPPGPILIQELTCPNPASMNASLAWQAACFEILLDAIGRNPRIRFASVFTLEDFDGATCAAVQQALGAGLDDVPPDFRQRFLDYLCGLGVLASDGTPHPAWAALLDFLQRPVGRLRLELRQGGGGASVSGGSSMDASRPGVRRLR
ncbi:hypothetical protein HFP89_06305 [Wenzhouxiangella sp. XN79A]|uniref:hypothetical protein n=1 Tax=Wenzhouxiangella sp. XN79A TaxID=2724193 RepID=UPI00144A8C3D|nr:hypothetical protein [Wenzhouxiangella sp. XN79A]NKI34774.1 hypothetical protein [Wenzhouxiangella sp. XN79A]